MALRKTQLETVDLGSAPIDRYESLLGEVWPQFRAAMEAFAGRMRGRIVWNVNSTPRGGGVAELLGALIPYDHGCGIDERWLVIDGPPQFFEMTKKIHNLLHGVAPRGQRLTDAEQRLYENVMAANAAALEEVMRPGDVAVLHDPQTAGLVPHLARRGVHVIWRSHVGIDEPNDVARSVWRFLAPQVEPAAAYVFSRRSHVWSELDSRRVHIIAPCIDPFTAKNQDLDPDVVADTLRASGIVAGSDGRATFERHEGGGGRVVRAANTDGAVLAPGARFVLQVSRWDRLKDPTGVLRGFVDHIAPKTDASLVLAGPAVDSVDDDPEQPQILSELRGLRDATDEQTRARIVIAQLPMEDPDENAAIVNALQRRADVVVQKSLAEGFGLTVAEAMWKSRPVVASRVGGIEDQIEDGKSGVLIDEPRDLSEFGRAVVHVLEDRAAADRLGREARLRVVREFLAPRHLMQQAELIAGLG